VLGLGKIKDIGPKGANEIVEGQPYTDYDDFKSKTSRRAINAPTLESLQRIGAFHSIGIAGEAGDADLVQFHFLGFTLDKPKAFKGCKPKHVSERTSQSGWHHLRP
jgi:hypothetical protein